MINILFGGNYKVFDGILLCLLTIIKHTNSTINVYILSANLSEINPQYIPITESQLQLLNELVKKKNKDSGVNLILLEDDFKVWANKSKNKLSSYTPFAFLRLFADKVKELPSKIIYLDTDTMLNNDINLLFQIDISKHELGVVKDRYGRFFINPKYFNSGVLLMNLEKIKESKLFEKVRNICLTKKMAFPDQSGLNKFCKHKLYLPRKFNEQGKLKNDTVVHHFSKKFKIFPFFHTINIKPWQIDKVKTEYKLNQYDDVYEEYTKIKSTVKDWHFNTFALK